jgi:hypothetical protein
MQKECAKTQSHLVHGVSLVGSCGKGDVGIIGRSHPKLYLPGGYGIEVVLQLILSGKC